LRTKYEATEKNVNGSQNNIMVAATSFLGLREKFAGALFRCFVEVSEARLDSDICKFKQILNEAKANTTKINQIDCFILTQSQSLKIL